jgi:multidrug efflux pump subunit AcrA (membrane-fusion protein)
MLSIAITLPACSADLGASDPTPEPWAPPATATLAAAATEAPTVAAEPETAPTATSEPDSAGVAVPAGPQSYIVQRGSVTQILELDGQVVPTQRRELSFTQDGILQALHVAPGSVVQKGQLLAELDTAGLVDQLNQAKADYEKNKLALERAAQEQRFPVRRAQIDLESARARLARLQVPDEAAIARARAAVQQAQANLDKTRNDASAVKNQAEQKLRQAQDVLIAAQAEYSAAYHESLKSKDSAVRERLLRAQEALHAAEQEVARLQIDYDTARGNEIAAIRSAEAQVAIAQADLEKALKGPDRTEIDEARRSVQLAELALEEAQQRARPDPDLTQQAEAARLRLEEIQQQVTARQLYAPFDGEVIAVTAAEGATVRAYEPLLVALDSSIATSDMEILVNGGAGENAPVLNVGQPVEIVFARYKDKTYPGTIAEVVALPLANDPSVPAGAVYHVRYEAQGLELDANDQALVKITVGHKENALWLPPQAIRFDNQYFVILQQGQIQERVDIQVGIIGSDRIEVLEGLEEGNVVLGQ